MKESSLLKLHDITCRMKLSAHFVCCFRALPMYESNGLMKSWFKSDSQLFTLSGDLTEQLNELLLLNQG